MNEQDKTEIEKVILQGKCLQAIKDMEKVLEDLKNSIMADCKIRFGLEDTEKAYLNLKIALNEWNKFKIKNKE